MTDSSYREWYRVAVSIWVFLILSSFTATITALHDVYKPSKPDKKSDNVDKNNVGNVVEPKPAVDSDSIKLGSSQTELYEIQ